MNNTGIKPIICGSDFSESAARAATVADALARRLETSLILAHSVDERGDFPDHLRTRLMNDDRPRLAEETARLRGLGLSFEETLLRGVPADGIASFAAREDARLIVVGASGTGSMWGSRWVLGNVAERIAETSSVPTLVAREAEPLVAWARGERPLRIFIAVDFSATSDAALKWVGEWRQVGPCEITVGHIYRGPQEDKELPMPDALDVARINQPARGALEHDLRERSKSLLGVAPTIRVEQRSARVDAHLIALATGAGADLLVLGTHQWHNLDRVWHASVSRRILHDAPMSVVCVPVPIAPQSTGAIIPQINRVLVATDFSDRSLCAIPHAYSTLPRQGGAVCLLHVVKPGDPSAIATLEDRLRALVPEEAAARGIITEVRVVEGGDFGQAICHGAERFGADLVCVGSHGHARLVAAVLGSVAQAVIAHSPAPVLVVRASSH